MYPNVAKVGGLQSQGGKGEAVVKLPRALDNAGYGVLWISRRGESMTKRKVFLEFTQGGTHIYHQLIINMLICFMYKNICHVFYAALGVPIVAAKNTGNNIQKTPNRIKPIKADPAASRYPLVIYRLGLTKQGGKAQAPLPMGSVSAKQTRAEIQRGRLKGHRRDSAG